MKVLFSETARVALIPSLVVSFESTLRIAEGIDKADFSTYLKAAITDRCLSMGKFLTLEFVEKKCGYNGRWEGQNGSSTGEESAHGWANYTTCMTPEILHVHEKVYTNTQEGEVIN